MTCRQHICTHDTSRIIFVRDMLQVTLGTLLHPSATTKPTDNATVHSSNPWYPPRPAPDMQTSNFWNPPSTLKPRATNKCVEVAAGTKHPTCKQVTLGTFLRTRPTCEELTFGPHLPPRPRTTKTSDNNMHSHNFWYRAAPTPDVQTCNFWCYAAAWALETTTHCLCNTWLHLLPWLLAWTCTSQEQKNNPCLPMACCMRRMLHAMFALPSPVSSRH
jgi:hypothetical protein